jgi:hypothetical protein
MYRYGLLLMLVIFATTALVSAQEGQPPVEAEPVEAEPILEKGPIDVPLFGPLTGVWTEVEVEAQRVEDPTLTEEHAADLCSSAPQLPLATYGTAGDQSTVNEMTESPDDPILACMSGSPRSPRGFRTVWYKFRAPVSGHLQVSTGFNPSDFEDSYDTVLALYRSADGSCGTLAQLACDDDSSGFLSELSYFVIEGVTYYIEVADWHLAMQSADTLRLSVVLEEGESYWEQSDSDSGLLWDEERSRHMVVTDGRYIYVIGGERDIAQFPDRDSMLQKFDPFIGNWVVEPPTSTIPSEEYAYSRTSAVYLNGRIYLPSGYIGHNSIYGGTHWTYDIANNQWFASEPVPWGTVSPTGAPYAWHQAVAVPSLNGYFLTGGLLSGDADPTPDPGDPPRPVATDNLLFYSESGIWQPRASMSESRYAHVAARLSPTPGSQHVCVAGGLTAFEQNPDYASVLASGECYDVASGTWSPIAPLNFPRFSAGSAVGPDGRWYVFGGFNSSLVGVPHTEVYDPLTNRWEILDSRYSLRNPTRAWPRGVFVGETLWVFGGEERTAAGNKVVPLVQKLEMPGGDMWLPVLHGAQITGGEPNDTFERAHPIGLFQTVEGDFSTDEDFFDFYRFHITETVPHTVHVTDIPAERDYDVYVFNANKHRVGESTNIGSLDEHATTYPLTPGTYYAMVLRSFGAPTTDTYKISVTR